MYMGTHTFTYLPVHVNILVTKTGWPNICTVFKYTTFKAGFNELDILDSVGEWNTNYSIPNRTTQTVCILYTITTRHKYNNIFWIILLSNNLFNIVFVTFILSIRIVHTNCAYELCIRIRHSNRAYELCIRRTVHTNCA